MSANRRVPVVVLVVASDRSTSPSWSGGVVGNGKAGGKFPEVLGEGMRSDEGHAAGEDPRRPDHNGRDEIEARAVDVPDLD
ncbi:hypothetical protein [Microbacterium tumbae]